MGDNSSMRSGYRAPSTQRTRQLRTSAIYNPKTHGPSHSTQSRLSVGDGLKSHHGADRKLEIGLVAAGDPGKYKAKGLPRSKARQQEQQLRGVLERDDNVSRPYIKMTDSIQPQAKIFTAKAKGDHISQAIKLYAADNKEEEPKQNITKVSNQAAKLTIPGPAVVTYLDTSKQSA
ncbi:hypothetical protein FLAG1_02261 [Fusarium langsethiae]|uniref:Uncharacterized protein n=1 Tax=Fusarium langsethiae TaxID=179993 RepID=A0A0M9F2P4_FUSLA|nr:hypothetical protein FLAG1_02261 [Fusarium langsethiae]GKU00732.1 unnamed protein product [Fusarium langsethiae]GKU11514.1 unnamed protein product [Fusarium langsethiae]